MTAPTNNESCECDCDDCDCDFVTRESLRENFGEYLGDLVYDLHVEIGRVTEDGHLIDRDHRVVSSEIDALTNARFILVGHYMYNWDMEDVADLKVYFDVLHELCWITSSFEKDYVWINGIPSLEISRIFNRPYQVWAVDNQGHGLVGNTYHDLHIIDMATEGPFPEIECPSSEEIKALYEGRVPPQSQSKKP